MTVPAAAHPLLDELLATIAERDPGARGASLTQLTRAMLGKTVREQLRDLPVDVLYAQLVGVFDFADARAGEPIGVRVVPSQPRGSAAEVNLADAPFLVDTVRAAVESAGYTIRLLLHPVVGVERDADGGILRLVSARDAGSRESIMRVEIDQQLDAAASFVLTARIREALADLQAVVRDFPAMKATVDQLVVTARRSQGRYGTDEIAEAVSFLDWLRAEHFVFLGARAYDIRDGKSSVRPGSGLGVLADEASSRFATPTPIDSLPEALRARLSPEADLLLIGKSNRPATVHRRERMDDIAIKEIDRDGNMTGVLRLVGLFTSLATMEQASRTPILRSKLQAIVEAEDLIEGSHDYKAAVAVFESFPREELFGASVEELRAEVMSVRRAEEASRIAVSVRKHAVSNDTSVLVVLPRDRMNTGLRVLLQELFTERFAAESVEYHLALGASGSAQLFFLLRGRTGEQHDIDLAALERDVAQLCRSWDDDFGDALARAFPEDEARRLSGVYRRRLPDYYKSATEPALALLDVQLVERLADGEPFAVGLQNESAAQSPADEPLTRVTIAKRGAKIPLGRFLPVLEHLGLTVLEEAQTLLEGPGEESHLHDFGVLVDGAQIDCAEAGSRVAEAISAVWSGRAESDTLNSLVVTAGLGFADVAVLRAYRRYRQLVSPQFTEAYQNDVLARNAELARLLVQLFRARFCEPGDESVLRATLAERLDAIESLDEDRILRGFLGLIDATVRSNAALGKPYISFKLRSEDVPQMPAPAPLFEIYVYSPESEGIHLRGGRVARGGIRWSDRREDYRTEVLGLMKAQMVKNAVIVPVGAKGGFVLRNQPTERDALRAEVVERYSTLIRGMLDITDNLVDGLVVRPEGVRAYDEDDPYLVVAADKGTATLSDTANAISIEYGFWLGDAFASGGSVGYDHKALGITARGAWESVKRHFRGLGHDVSARPFTVCGIGDMSGDVFGNGMLLSKQIRLVAAFDHRHVFLDPAPDPAASFAERSRLFELGVGTSWADYDASLISPGGGIFPRSAKSIPLSPEIRRALGVEAAELDPAELAKAILRAPVDLFWNGGIGTFVKASSESHADAGDRTNDAIRIDGRELRCRVFAEGGNLGLTQRGRIEYALAGGRINTDAIDNSAGVDCSDHEVNIKILVGAAIARGLVRAEDRPALLAELAGDVCRHVLYDNYLQAQILTQEEAIAGERSEAYEQLMRELEGEGLLDRTIEALPSGDELTERARQGRGLTRPELAVLLAYAKRSLYPKILASEIPDDPALDGELRRYFPVRLIEATGSLFREHQLRREIVATYVTNDVVNSLGIAWAWQMMAETGATAAEVVRAYWITREVVSAVGLWEDVEALFDDPSVDGAVQMRLMEGIDQLVQQVTRWYVQHAATGQMAAVIERDRPAFGELAQTLRTIGTAEWRTERALRREQFAGAGVPLPVATAASWRGELGYGPDVIAASRASGRSLAEAAEAFFAVGERLHLDWLEGQLTTIPAETRWQRWALAATSDDLHGIRRDVTERLLRGSQAGSIEETIELFVGERTAAMERLERLISSLRADGVTDVSAATVAVRQLRAALS